MAHINLLPWREARRKQREREFYVHLMTAFVVALLLMFLWVFWMNWRIDNQHQRNAYLQQQITLLDSKIKKIDGLEETRKHLLQRKKVIEHLQAKRPQMVHLFDALSKTIPDSVRLTGANQQGDALSLTGVAQANASVAQFMRQLEASKWLKNPVLVNTKNNHDGSRLPYSFSLSLTLDKPMEDVDDK